MQLLVEKMNVTHAIEVMNWRYEQPYDFYNNDVTDETMQELLDGSYYILKNEEGQLTGFFCIGESAIVPYGHQFGVYNEVFIDMGLGMNPSLVGQGNGFDFCSYIVKFIESHYTTTAIRLTVATFNKRAIRLYDKLGFVKDKEFHTQTTHFMTMIKNSNS